MDIKSYEAGAAAFLRGEPIPEGPATLAHDTKRHGWYEARRFMEGGGQRGTVQERERLTALWLEHRASTLELQAVELLSVGKGVEAEKAQDDGRSLEVAAAYIRRELLGESEESDAKP